jgi:hypothetical protein
MNDAAGGIELLPALAQSAASSPGSVSALGGQHSPPGQADRNTPYLLPPFDRVIRLRHDAAGKPRQNHLEVFAAQVRALTGALPSDEAFQALTRQFLAVADDAQTPLILAACGDFQEGKPALLAALLGDMEPSNPGGEPKPSAVALQYSDRSGLMACGESESRRAGTLQELKKLAQEDESCCAPLGRILSRLILDPFRDRTRNCLLVFVPGYIPASAGGGDTALSLLRRAEAMVWLATASIPAINVSRGASGHGGQPIDLLVASDLDPIPTGDAGQPSTGDAAPALLLRDVQERFGDLFRDSRLAQMRAAALRLSGSPTLHAGKIQNAVSRVQEGVEELTRRLEKLTNAVRQELDNARTRPTGSMALQEEIVQRWEERRSGPCDWLSAAEDEVVGDEEFLPAGLRQECDDLRMEFAALGKSQRSLQREQARNLEERRFHERRLQEMLQEKERNAGQNLVLQILNGMLGKDSERLERELAAEQALWEQCCAEEGELTRTAEEFARRGDEISLTAQQLAGRIVAYIQSVAQESAFLSQQRHFSLRKARWQLQANAGLVSAAATIARICAALEETAIDMYELAAADGPFVPCIKALRDCRRACNSLLPLRGFAGNARMLRIYRRILSQQRMAQEAAVSDCGGLLRALDTALKQAPREELWRELSSATAPGNPPLAQFAEGIAAWLCEPDRLRAERALRALARMHADDQTMAEVGDFVRRHGGEKSEEFLAALPAPAASPPGVVLRSAPRSSPAYRQAILRLGAELLDLFETARETE